MPKQLNVNLAFTADTGKAAASIKSLQQQLTELMSTGAQNSHSLGLTKEIKEATTAVAQLKTSLASAINSTGNLDLTKFNDSLKASGMTLEQYRVKLSALGSDGTAAFSQLASSIASAEIPIRRANGLLKEMGTTLANTVRWQLSSSMLHGFMGTIQSAFGYAKDLNESLNNIQIVTQHSSEYMAEFAERANKAAQALNTTTTKYTDASLIFYQQGLNDAEVEKRTAVTIKMANAARESAEVVSQELTSVWNNFYDGSKSLEYYADVMTKLGAETASSSAEIANGLQKFAAIGDTVGLSYEYAASALATITATTRESADTVGNALKTLFARIQGLKLGETLEDGVDLNKYSQALESVGISILEANGELKDMDIILDELMERWGQLSDAQQTALAQTVAGQRQYAQFMTLMNNADFFQENVNRARNSEGSLQAQADVYAQSWEAARDRVKAAAEGIYQSLIDDKFFIGVDDLISGILNSINGLIKGLGGIPGVLTTIGALLTRIFNTQMAANIDRVIGNITGSTARGAKQLQEKAISELEAAAVKKASINTAAGNAEAQALNDQARLQKTLYEEAKNYTAEQEKTAQLLLDNNAKLREQAIAENELLDKARAKSELEKKSIAEKARRTAENDPLYDPNKSGQISDNVNKVKELENELQKLIVTEGQVESHFTSLRGVIDDPKLAPTEKFAQLKEIMSGNSKELISLFQTMGIGSSEYVKLGTALQKLKRDASPENFENLKNVLDNLSDSMGQKIKMSGDQLASTLTTLTGSSEKAAETCERLIAIFGEESEAGKRAAEALKVLRNDTESADEAMKKMETSSLSIGQVLSGVSSIAMSLASVIRTLSSFFDILTDSEKTTQEKFSAFLNMIPALLMSLSMLSNSLTSVVGKGIIQGLASITPSFLTMGASAKVAAGGVSAFGSTLLTVMPWVVGLAAVIGGLSFVFNQLEKSTFSYQISQAEKAAADAKQEFEETKQKAEELQSAFDQYQSIRDQLDNCTVGTEEWRTKLHEVNEQVLNIIQNFPQLRKYMSMENGVLTLNPNGVDQYSQMMKYQNLGAYWSQQEADQNVSDLKNAQTYDEYYSQGSYNDVTQLFGGELPSWIDPNLYTADFAGAAENVFNRYLEARENGESIDDWESELKGVLIDTLTNNDGIYKDNIEDATTFINEIFAENSNQIMDHFLLVLSQMESLASSQEQAADNKQMINPQLGSMILSQNEAFMNRTNSEAVLGVTGPLIDRLSEEITKKYTKSDGEGLNEELVREEYKKRYGEDSIYQTDENGEIDRDKYIDTNTLFRTLAVEEIDQQLPDLMTPVLDWYNDMIDTGEKETQAIAKILTNNKASEEEMRSLADKLGEDRDDLNIGKLLQEQLGLSDPTELLKVAQSFGKETIPELFDAIRQGLEDYDTRVEAAQTFSKQGAQEVFDLGLKNTKQYQGLELEQKEQFHDLIENTPELMDQNEIFSFFQDNIDNFDEILNALNDSNSLVDLISNLQDLGIEVNEDSAIIDIFYQNLSKFKNIDDPSARYAERKKVVDQLNKGDTIDQEQYDTLGKLADGYFQLMADGTYKLIEDAKLLRQAVDESVFKDFKNQFSQYYKHGRGDWTEEDQQKAFASTTSMAKIAEQYENPAYGNEFYGMNKTHAMSQYKEQRENETYSSLKDVFDAYNDTVTLSDGMTYRALGLETAKEKIKEVIDTTQLGKEELDELKEAFDSELIDSTLFEKGVHSIASGAKTFEELDEIIKMSDIDAELFTDDIIALLNQTGGTTEEKIANLRHELEEGNGDAQKLLSTMYELNSANDNTQTTSEKITENNATNEANQKSDMSDADKAESNKQAGLSNIGLIANADDMFDTDKVSAFYTELKKVQQGEKLTAIEARQLGQAASQIFRDADFLGTEKQIQGIKDAFAAVDGEIEPENLKAYADAIKDLILNSESMTLDKKLETIKTELTEAGVPLSYLNEELGKTILADQNLSLDEKLARIKEELGENIPNELSQEIEKIVANDSMTAEEGISKIKELCGDTYQLQEFSEWVDKILNNNGTNTFEKISQLLQLLKEGMSTDEMAGILSDQYSDQVKNAEDLGRLISNNNNNIIQARQATKDAAENTKEANNNVKAVNSATTITDKDGKTSQDNSYEAMMARNKAQQELNKSQEDYNNAKEYEQKLEESISKSYQEYAQQLDGSKFDSIKDLESTWSLLSAYGANVTEGMKESDLVEYASQFDRCTDAVNNYYDALNRGEDVSDELLKLLSLASIEDAAKAYELDADQLQTLTQSYLEMAQSQEDYSNTIIGNIEGIENSIDVQRRATAAAMETAVRDMEVIEAKKTAAKETENYNKVLNILNDETEDGLKTNKQARILYEDLADSEENLREGMAALLHVQKSMISDNMLKKYGKLAVDALNDVEGALEELQEKSEVEFLINLGVDEAQAQQTAEDAMSYLNELDPGESIDWSDETWQSAFDSIVQAAIQANTDVNGVLDWDGMVEDANTAFDQIGVDGIDLSPLAQSIEEGAVQVEDATGHVVDATGIDVEATQDVAEETAESEFTGVDVEPGNEATITFAIPRVRAGEAPGGEGQIPIADGVEILHGHAEGYRMVPRPEPQEVTKREPLMGVQATGGNKTAGGNIQKPSGGGGGGGRRGGCFIAGTPVTTINGYKNIEDIQVGDIVLSYNEQKQKNEYSIVADTMIHVIYDNIYTLYINNERLNVTGIHKFLIKRNNQQQWIQASELKVNDLVLFADGGWHTIDKIDIRVELKVVYNFEVSHNHNYYVGYNQILAHNKGGGRRGGGGGRAAKKTTQKAVSIDHKDSTERYHYLEKSVENLNKQYEQVNKAKDLAFGAQHLKAIRNEISLHDSLIKKQKEYRDEIKKNLELDKAALTNTSNALSSEAQTKFKTTVSEVQGGSLTKKQQKQLAKLQNKKGSLSKKQKKKLNKLAAKAGNLVQREVFNSESISLGEYLSGQGSRANFVNAGAENGAVFDKNDLVSNIADLKRAADNRYNANADYYAKKHKDVTYDGTNLAAVREQEALSNWWAQEQAAYEQAMKNIEQYEETLRLYWDKIAELIDQNIERIKAKVEEAVYTVDIKIELDDLALENINFQLERLGDNGRNAAAQISELGKVLDTNLDKIKLNEEGMANVFSTIATGNLEEITDEAGQVWKFGKEDSDYLSGGDIVAGLKAGKDSEAGKAAIKQIMDAYKQGTVTTEQIDKWTEKAKDNLSLAQETRENYYKMFDYAEAGIDYWNQKMEDIIAKQEHLNGLIEHHRNVVDLVGRAQVAGARDAGRVLEASLDATAQQANNLRTKHYKTEYEAAKSNLSQIETQISNTEKLIADAQAEGGDKNRLKELEEDLVRYQELYNQQAEIERNAQNNMNAAFEEALQYNLDSWTRAMDRAVEEFQNSLAGSATSLDYLADALQRFTDTHSTNVAEYEKVHQLRMLDLQAQKAIDEATDPRIQRELLDIQNEISASTNKNVKMSQYELDYLKQKLELKQAEAAFEDAQQAKTQVSLTRDNEGNFGYVYTANDGDVAAAEQNYQDKIYEMQKANAEYIQDLQSQIVAAQQDYQSRMQEVANDTTLSEEERQRKMSQIAEDYQLLRENLLEQLEDSLMISHEVYGQYSERYAEVTGDLTALDLEYIGKFEETQLAKETGFNNLIEYGSNWGHSEEKLMTDLQDAWSNYNKAQEESFTAAGEKFSEYGENVSGEAEKIKGEISNLTETMDDAATKSKTAFEQIAGNLAALQEKYSEGMTNMIETTGNFVEALIEAQREMFNLADIANSGGVNGAADGAGGLTKVTPQGGSTRAGGNGPNTLVIKRRTYKRQIRRLRAKQVRNLRAYKNKVRQLKSQRKYTSASARRRAAMDKKIQKEALKAAKKSLIKKFEKNSKLKKYVLKYDTGGYTGTWGDNSGKLAMLHQKELVLNKDDTENILSAVGVIRDLAQKIDLNALASAGAFSSGISGINGVSNGVLEQEVHITAEFPNATDRNEITEAFNNIIGLAAQYANK